MKTLFETQYYNVVELVEPIPIEQNGVTLHFHYGTFNTWTEKMEGYAQFLTSAVDQAVALNDGLVKLLPQVEAEGNVVPFNS